MAANTASAVLVSSNPTNILITGSFSLNYLTDFTKWTILPSIIPAIVNYPVLLLMFWKRIPKTLVPLQENPWSKLRDPKGALFLSCLMLLTLAVLIGTTFVPGGAVQVWMVTAPAGILAFLFELASDWFRPKIVRKVTTDEKKDPASDKLGPKNSSHPPLMGTEPNNPLSDRANMNKNSSPSSSKHADRHLSASNPSAHPTTLTSLLRSFNKHFPRTSHTVRLLPFTLLPFAMAEFIMIRGLSQRGWIHVFASAFGRATTRHASPAAAIFFFGFVSAAFLCPLAGTNIGATILLVEILRDPALFAGSVLQPEQKTKILQGAIYALAMGSNLGAFSYTFAGSLAGLLWRGLLADKGVQVSQLKFALVNAVPLLLQTTLACAILVSEIYWFG